MSALVFQLAFSWSVSSFHISPSASRCFPLESLIVCVISLTNCVQLVLTLGPRFLGLVLRFLMGWGGAAAALSTHSFVSSSDKLFQASAASAMLILESV